MMIYTKNKAQNISFGILFVTAVCLLFFTQAVIVQAEEDVNPVESSKEESEKRVEMKAQIEALKDQIEDNKKLRTDNYRENKEERKTQWAETKKENKEQRTLDVAKFRASLEGLSEEEKKAAMMDFIAEIREMIKVNQGERKETVAEKKVELKERKEVWVEDREVFRASLEGLTREEKVAAIMERLKTINEKMSADKDVKEDKSN